MIEIISSLVTSPITNVVLFLLLFFQWDRQHAKEQSIKNDLFAMRRMLDHIYFSKESSGQFSKEMIIEQLDGTLATLDARSPFIERWNEVVSMIKKRFRQESEKDLKRLPHEIDQTVKD